MDESIISTDTVRVIALEEGLRAGIVLDSLRLSMLNQAVDWLCELTGMQTQEVRRQLAQQKGGQVAKSLSTINAVRSVLSNEQKQK